MLITCAKFQGQKIHLKNIYSKSTSMCYWEKDFFSPWNSVILCMEFHMDVKNHFPKDTCW